LPAEFPADDAEAHSFFLVEQRIPELTEEIRESQGGDTQSQLAQRKLPELYRYHFIASGLVRQIGHALAGRTVTTDKEFEKFLNSLESPE
jgi:hypothetical protein